MSKTLILTENGLKLAVDGGQLVVERGHGTIARIKHHEIEQVVLMGKIEVTSSAVSLLLKEGIDCVFLSSSGSYKGRLVGNLSKNVLLRIRQFERFSDRAFATKMAASIVAGKITNQRNILMRVQRELSDRELANDLARMRRIKETLKDIKDLDIVRGYEGEAAAIYFKHFGKAIKNPDFSFTGRNKRPPRDPINACLSFGYTLLAVVLESMIMEIGFDPFLGCLHEPSYGRPSMVLDMMEEFRPIVVDSLVLRLINRRQLTLADFGPPEREVEFSLEGEVLKEELSDTRDAIYLQGSGRKVFVTSFFARLRERIFYEPTGSRLDIRQIMRQQVYMMARVVRGEQESYQPFTTR